jgi:hypothetical protein
MWWKRKAEWLPWYRARNYKGNLTEAEKRQLDVFRMQPRHPADHDLPEEVRRYICNITLELYDRKQDAAAGRAWTWSAIGAALLFGSYMGWFGAPTIWLYALGAWFLVFPWFVYRYEWKKNAEEFLPSDHSHNAIDEGIRQEWELNWLYHNSQEKRDAPDQ